jgi:hypothetical protein
VIRGDAKSRAATDLVSHRGKLSSGKREWIELATQIADANSAHPKPIVLCANDAELCVMARVGISCSPMAGVDQLTGKQIRSLFNTRLKHAQQRRNQIVLLGWQPDALANEPSAKNLAAIRHVANIQRTYGFDPHSVFSVWLPTHGELARIRRAHTFVDRDIVAKECKVSMRHSLWAPEQALTLLSDRRPATWANARTMLESAVERSFVVPRVSETNVALEKLKRAYHDQVVRPLEAARGKAGLEAVHSLMAADLAGIWYQDLEIVDAARRVIAGHHPGYAKPIDDAALNRKLRLVSTMTRLARVKFN